MNKEDKLYENSQTLLPNYASNEYVDWIICERVVMHSGSNQSWSENTEIIHISKENSGEVFLGPYNLTDENNLT